MVVCFGQIKFFLFLTKMSKTKARTPYQGCKSLVKECDDFLKEPFQHYMPNSWYYRWWYIPKCGEPDYESMFKHHSNKSYCIEVSKGTKPFYLQRFQEHCLLKKEPLLKKYVIPKQEQTTKKQCSSSSTTKFFSFWKQQTQNAQQSSIQLPLIQHKKQIRQKVDSGHGMFMLIGNAFLKYRHENAAVYDPFFNHQNQFDIRWFGRVSSVPGSYYLFNLLYSHLLLQVDLEEFQNPKRWVVKKDNFHQFKMNLNTNKNELTIHISCPILSSFTRTFSLKDKEFLCFPFTMVLPNGQPHASNLVYHLSNQSWEHFESNGYIWFLSDYLDDWLENKLSNLIQVDHETFLPYRKFFRVKDITPYPTFQQLDKLGTIKDIDTAEYCATWTFWYLNIRFSNPSHTPSFVVEKIISNIQVKAKKETYIVFIRSFALLLSKILDELLQVFSGYYLKSWIVHYKTYQDKIREIFDFYIQTYFS